MNTPGIGETNDELAAGPFHSSAGERNDHDSGMGGVNKPDGERNESDLAARTFYSSAGDGTDTIRY